PPGLPAWVAGSAAEPPGNWSLDRAVSAGTVPSECGPTYAPSCGSRRKACETHARNVPPAACPRRYSAPSVVRTDRLKSVLPRLSRFGSRSAGEVQPQSRRSFPRMLRRFTLRELDQQMRLTVGCGPSIVLVEPTDLHARGDHLGNRVGPS